MLADYRTARLSDADRALFEYVEKLNREPASITGEDVAKLHGQGWTDEAIYDAVMVCGLFNFYNRWVDGTGDHRMDLAAYRASGRRIARDGYSHS